jgi:hypothetical protein
MAGGKKHLGYGCGYVEDIREAEHRQRMEPTQRGRCRMAKLYMSRMGR